MAADTLQKYVLDRLDGCADVPWLDAMPLYDAVMLAEIVGAVARHGIDYRSRSLDHREWSRCAGEGFDIVAQGESAFRAFVNGLVRGATVRSDASGRSFLGFRRSGLAEPDPDAPLPPASPAETQRLALTTRRYAAPFDVVLEVDDELIAANAGRWRLTATPDRVTCTSTVEPADLVMDIRMLGAAYLGDAVLGALAAGGEVAERRPGALAGAAAGFTWNPAPSCMEIF